MLNPFHQHRIGAGIAIALAALSAPVFANVESFEQTTANTGVDPAQTDHLLLVRFEPGVIGYPVPEPDKCAPSEVLITSSVVEATLAELGLVQFEVVGKGWRHTDLLGEQLDIHGDPVRQELIDFTDVYALRFEGLEATKRASRLLSTMDEVVYVDDVAPIHPLSCATSTFSIEDAEFAETASRPGQWCFDDNGLFEGTGDVDINLPEAFSLRSTTSKKVAVIDRGADIDHPDLDDKIDFTLSRCFGSLCIDDFDIDDPGGIPAHGHGTHMAGLIAAEVNNGSGPPYEGVAGVTGVSNDRTLVVLRIRNNGNDLIDAIDYIANDTNGQVPIISMSLLSGLGNTLRDALANAAAQGILLVSGMGNSQEPPFSSGPYGFANFVFAVGGIDIDGTSPSHFNTGPAMDVVAPGPPGSGDLYATTDVGGGYTGTSATSGATAITAGAASLLLAEIPSASAEDLEWILETTAEDYGAAGYDTTFGHGLIRLDEALCAVQERVLERRSATGYSRHTSELRNQDFRNIGFGDTDEQTQNYLTRVYRVEKDVSFPNHPVGASMSEDQVWGRGLGSDGWSDDELVDGALDYGWVDVEGGSVTSSGCTLYSYFYKVYDGATESSGVLGWFPRNPLLGIFPIDWEYSYLRSPLTPSRPEWKDITSDLRIDAIAGGGLSIQFTSDTVSPATLEIFGVDGTRIHHREIGTVSGAQTIAWDGYTDRGRKAPGGIYFVRLKHGDYAQSGRAVVVR